MGRTVRVDLGDRGYDIVVGRGVEPGARLKEAGVRTALIVTDSHVDPLYGAACEARLRALGIEAKRAVVEAGETSKDLRRLESLYRAALGAGLDRSSAIVALGGGVVGDLAGFAAATFLRGVAFSQAPTTLLAMVDSSVGGKTGVNLPEGKNLVGAFHQPCEVCADVAKLATLPDREYASGLAEVVKYGVIWDAVLFERLEREADALRARDAAVVEDVVARCCEVKAEVVRLDEKETGVRAILNFGHTLGHALESAAGYGTLLHGEAVSMGMVFAARLSARLRGFAGGEVERLVALLERLGLPSRPSGAASSWEALRQGMGADKKARGRMPRFVLVDRIGAVVFGCEAPESAMEETLRACV
jgi:3-dehydroquinate synthase